MSGPAPAAPVAVSRFMDAQIEMAHGAGGKATRRLINGLIAPLLMGGTTTLGDAAMAEIGGAELALTADSFVVRPLQFPGGSIGELAVNGTVNDLAVAGARPHTLLVTLVLEAGLRTEILEREMHAMAAAARRAGVAIAGGDTKVVEHGHADGMYVTTAGIGVKDRRASLSAAAVRPGDRILLSGYIGDHGCTVLLARGGIELDASLRSDTRSLWPMVDRLLDAVGPAMRWMRDPTRGGVATALNELAADTDLSIAIQDDRVPVRDEVRGVCELLGLDPLHIANEGQLLAVVSPEAAEAALAVLRHVDESATIIGEVRAAPARTVVAESTYGGARVIDMLVGDPLPRIC
ncbi:MAG TPA: hydrogenase expression/formation protein HypE [Vicinamibacterales bacterium]|nr:hydrogenase expression/formation protein HypE [Vicinamibacterales bacterium]